MNHPVARLVFVALGWLSLIVGIIGIFLPLLPTVPFVLLAAFCFSKGSPRLHLWLLARPHVGPMIRDWERNRSIPRRAKIAATVTLLGLFAIGQWVGRARQPAVMEAFPLWGWIGVGAMLIGVLTFIWTRPDGAARG